MNTRELTGAERRGLRDLVLNWCANYDSTYKHCYTGRECQVLGMTHADKLCRYFKNSVLPNNPELESKLIIKPVDEQPEQKQCQVCGKLFMSSGRKAYCSDLCQRIGNRDKNRERQRRRGDKNSA